jgi:hypothetical protein
MEGEMKTIKAVGLAFAALLLFALLGLVSASPALASAPGIYRNFGPVAGVDGSGMSIDQMNLGTPDMLGEIAILAPAVVSDPSSALVTAWRVERMGRNYVQISGKYCKNKTGGDVFVADGAPIAAGLTC